VSARIASHFYSVVDDCAVVRAMILIYPGQEWECKQRSNQVTVAVSFILGENVGDCTGLSPEAARYELARREARRRPGFSAEVVGLLAICDERNISYALVSVLRGREGECQKVATAAQFTIARFERRQMFVRVYEI